MVYRGPGGDNGLRIAGVWDFVLLGCPIPKREQSPDEDATPWHLAPLPQLNFEVFVIRI